MSNGQLERRMEFIVEQQAKNTIDIQKLQVAQSALTKKHNHLTEALTTVVGMVGKLAEAQEKTEENLTELANKQAETDGRLNILVDVVERYFSGNGKQRNRSRKLKSLRNGVKGSSKKSPRKK
jgi:hypothetical protein